MASRLGIGAGIGIPFRNIASGGGKPYLSPEVKEALKAVVIAYGKTNNDSDRAIVKNLVDASNPFVISNAAFKLNSGFGKYEVDFTSWNSSSYVSNIRHDSFDVNKDGTSVFVLYKNIDSSSSDTPSFKIKVSNLINSIIYAYINDSGVRSFFNIKENGEYILPKSYNSLTPTTTWIGFRQEPDVNCECTITQIPSFQGAFVTDGIDDLITSTKTVQEMLGGSNKITVVSMIHHIYGTSNSPSFNYTNYIREDVKSLRTTVKSIGESGIYGYTYKNSSAVVINNILGDKNDYSVNISGTPISSESKFSVQGYIDNTNNPTETSQVAWYWTIIANKVLTTDQINQVIAYYNLDKYVKPDIYYDVKKQGLSNNTPDSDWYLKDFSGNGRDMQLYNFAKKLGSGIGKYEEDFTTWNKFSNVIATDNKLSTNKDFNSTWIVYKRANLSEISQMTIKVIGLPVGGILRYLYIKEGEIKQTSFDITKDGIYELPASYINEDISHLVGFHIPYINYDWSKLVIEQIPDYEGALVFDALEDYGQFVGDLGLKDYTLIMNRAYNNLINNQVPLISSNIVEDQTPFIVEHWNTGSNAISFSYGASRTTDIPLDINKKTVYQSTYSYMGYVIPKGNAISTGGGITLGKFGNGVQYSAICLWSLMLFPYSLSEFLIERQLKKHKLGTLYPDMVEFRPIVKSNSEYQVVDCYIDLLPAVVGKYYPINSKLRIAVTTKGAADEITSLTVNGVSLGTPSVNGNRFTFNGTLSDKSPQKINITIDEYIRYEDIVQPYPSLFTLIDYDTEEVYSWGSKLKVGARFKGNVVNLLPNMYEWQGNVLYNGEVLDWGIKPGVVAKEMVFSWNMPFKYLIDNNEPKCILSPRLLRIPNSSYKILGYIPDISGHGNHGVIHNSAYAEGSGVNEDGSYQFDGVDDHITIPTLSSGGKQVLMKVNWNTINSIIYDQRDSGGFAIYCSDYNNPSDSITVPAYKGRNAAGTTYIDGIRNEYIIASQLRNVTHNIVEILDTSYAAGNINPIIGKSYMNSNYGSLALYDFMLFDNISTDDKIKQLNEYVGIEAKVELPPYYWDAYGKSNLDEDRDSIKQRGVAVGDYDITNYNHAYDKMSGYGGYEFAKFDNTLDWYNTEGNDSVEVVSRNGHSITLKRLTGSNFWYFQNSTFRGLISNVIPFKVNSNKNIAVIWDVHGLSISEGKDKSVRVQELVLNPNEDNYTNLKTLNEEELAQIDISTNSLYYLLWFDLSTLAVNEEVTIEMLPLYPNGLVYDGITDYSKNANIPALTDFTVIAKRVWMNKDNPMNECFIHKGVVSTSIRESALMLEYEIGNDTYYRSSSYGGYINIERSNRPEIITYQTTESYNGISIIKGSGIDTQGLVVGAVTNNYWKGVFYKLILYPKTIPLLQINFLKNLMERDEIIDLNNPIFIQE